MEYVLGTEYMGRERVTKSGALCEPWLEAMIRMDAEAFHIIGNEFPTNLCRNPDGFFEGPYCYTKGGFIETCAIPSCCGWSLYYCVELSLF